MKLKKYLKKKRFYYIFSFFIFIITNITVTTTTNAGFTDNNTGFTSNIYSYTNTNYSSGTDTNAYFPVTIPGNGLFLLSAYSVYNSTQRYVLNEFVHVYNGILLNTFAQPVESGTGIAVSVSQGTPTSTLTLTIRNNAFLAVNLIKLMTY